MVLQHYGTVSTDISSAHGEGDIDTTGYGVGANLTWYGDNGLYIDGQAQATWYDTDLNSDTANLNLVAGNRGFGYGLSIEAGKRIEIDQQWQITPQAQLVYSDVEFDSFTDAFDARVELKNGGSLKGRIGAAVEYENSWLGESGKAVHTNLYGIANLYYEFLDGTKTDISATSFISRSERLTGGLGLGGDYTWQDGKYAVYGEVSVITTLAQLGDNYSLNGTTGFKVKW
ncbi:autotransporter outer membrane beta-barrel domain-containing protein [Phyllobacterium sp. YR531]|uniref:autotransporter outer membrane beta-barrel domain-containing protein n=1 Tax=Phyllobacterium sp. YR531 TaxID=1144343 RepID=UPI00026FC348|nr:autotransporter outer membrane beta-barrel domain-containing protein [Phyllobacterium sp. YR531]EJN04837.1 outer membrane autotransporter barrel domain-containing protein [Phyllobacterium sp. YR531]